MVDMDKYRHIKWDEKETLQQAQIALDMMRDFHGKSLIETHGPLDGRLLREQFGIGRWDKNNEYKVWLQEVIPRFETATDPDDVFTENEWQAVESYAIENTGIDESVVLKGNRFRKLYFDCSRKKGCVTIEGDEMSVDERCRIGCLEEASKESGFITVEELKRLR
jgi:hypothetical protein